MHIFLSYPSTHQDAAEQLSLSLASEGHTVFYDRTSLAAGQEFDRQIREEIERSDYFVFLVSPESVAKGRYTLTELMLARKQWPHPKGHVLPVLIEPTEMSTIPAYLRAVTLLVPEGNLAAEVLAHITAMPAVERASNGTASLPVAALLFAVPIAWLIGHVVTLALVGLGPTPFVIIGIAGGAVCSVLIASFGISLTGSAASIGFWQLFRVTVCFLLAGLYGGFVGLLIWLPNCTSDGTPVIEWLGCRDTSKPLWKLVTGSSSALALAGAGTVLLMEFGLTRLRQTGRGRKER